MIAFETLNHPLYWAIIGIAIYIAVQKNFERPIRRISNSLGGVLEKHGGELSMLALAFCIYFLCCAVLVFPLTELRTRVGVPYLLYWPLVVFAGLYSALLLKYLTDMVVDSTKSDNGTGVKNA